MILTTMVGGMSFPGYSTSKMYHGIRYAARVQLAIFSRLIFDINMFTELLGVGIDSFLLNFTQFVSIGYFNISILVLLLYPYFGSHLHKFAA